MGESINQDFIEAMKAYFRRAMHSALAICGESDFSAVIDCFDLKKLERLAQCANARGDTSLQLFLDQFYEQRGDVQAINEDQFREFLGRS